MAELGQCRPESARPGPAIELWRTNGDLDGLLVDRLLPHQPA